jgi:hypothetical protein
MIPTAALLASAAATVVVIAACLRIAKATAELRQDLDELKRRDRFAPPAEPETGRPPSPRMMSALYPERGNPLDFVSGIPAAPAFALGGTLTLLAGILGLMSPAPTTSQSRPDAEVAALRTVDSMAVEVRRLTDSLRLAVVLGARPQQGQARPVRQSTPARPASVPSPLEIPPAPSLQPGESGLQVSQP